MAPPAFLRALRKEPKLQIYRVEPSKRQGVRTETPPVRRLTQPVRQPPDRGEELRALRRLQRESGPSPYVFQSERGGPMTLHALFGRIAGKSAL